MRDCEARPDAACPPAPLAAVARPLRLARLLFLPLEGALVMAGAWRRGSWHLPRNAIPPIAAALRAAQPQLEVEVEAAARAHTMADAAAVAALGERIWPAAGAVTLPAKLPGWYATGLPEEAAAPMLALCAGVWRHAPSLWRLRAAAPEGAMPEEALRAALAPLAAEGAGPLAAGMALLLGVAGEPGRVAAVVHGLSPGVARLVEQEAARRRAGDDTRPAAGATGRGAPAGARPVGNGPAGTASACAPPRTGAGDAARGAATSPPRGETCAACYAETMARRLLAPVAEAAAGPPAADAAVAALEAAARDLGRLEAACRRRGEAASLERIRRDAVARLAQFAARPGGLAPVELARLAEIIAGTEAALPLLGPAPRG